MEYSIGDFSRISRLGIKTLRYYHEIGLLKPSRIDRFSGYRYYDEALLERTRSILRLKTLGFSLDEIKSLLEGQPGEADLLALVRNKVAELENKINEYEQMRARLQGFLQSEQNKPTTSASSAVSEVNVPDIYMAGLRFQGRYEDIGEWSEKLFQKCGRQINGPLFSLYYDSQSMEDMDADIEVCLPLQDGVKIEGLSCRWLPGGQALSVIHSGPYEFLSLTYQKIAAELYRGGHPVRMPARECYLKGPGILLPGDPNQYQTEIQFMLSENEPRPVSVNE